MHTYALVGAPSSTIRIFCRFGSKRRLVATIEWLRLLPKPGFLAQIEQTRDNGHSPRERGGPREYSPQPAAPAARHTRVARPHPAPAPDDVAGACTIAPDVVAQIVGLTVLECYGVVGMAASNLTQGVARLLTRDRLTQGVQVRTGEGGLDIDLYVVVEFGLNLAEVAANVRSRVQYQVERQTKIPVRSLGIHIQGVKRTQ